ncbi:hypothetical protein [Lentzea sp. CA-135723]|uniref:hypothetical protein n=1 Tax=Lentzea sp. CA-135723 TaxID=3239950 RepID=UPI003D8F81EF
MRRLVPLPRWLRRTTAFIPLAVLTGCPTAVFLVHPALINVITVPLALLATGVGIWVVRVDLRADRHATPSMAARYRALAQLLDDADDREVRLDPERRFSILLRDESLATGSGRRALLRFDQAELDRAGHDGVATPVVFDHFSLDPVRPVVRHWFGAVTITRDQDGRTYITDIPQPHHDKRAASEAARLLTTTAADIAELDDLDVLIIQIQTATAITP